MATINHLGISITQMSPQEVYTLLHHIREVRRTRPLARKSAPAKVARAPSHKQPKPQDLFALAEGMTTTQKAALAATLMRTMIQDD